MLPSAKQNEFITPRVIPQKQLQQKTRNISSSLKASITDTTANASDSIKHKKNHTIQYVHPFTYLDPPKVPSTSRNMPSNRIINNTLTAKTSTSNNHKSNDNNICNKENAPININTLFKMKNYQTSLLKYSMTKSKITRQNVTKPKLNRLIYVEMNHNFINKKILVKSCKDKTLERESKDAKIKMRFWKGVIDSSYPKILIKKINCWKKYSNRTSQCVKNNINNNLNKEIDRKKKVSYVQDIEDKRMGKRKYTSFNQSKNNYMCNHNGTNNSNSNANVNSNLGYSTIFLSNRNSMIVEHCHQRSKAVIINKIIL